jgi:GTPase SAR1 family protein
MSISNYNKNESHVNIDRILVRKKSINDIDKFQGFNGTCVYLHAGKYGWIKRYSEKKYLVKVKEFPANYIIHIYENYVLFEVIYDDELTDSILFDVVVLCRGLLECRFRSIDYTKMHISLLDYKGYGIGFIGPSGSGKTTFLLSAICNNKDTKFVSNDKVLVNMKYHAYGLPFAISLNREVAFKYLSYPGSINDRFLEQEVYIWPNDYFKSRIDSIQPTTILRVLVSTDLDLTINNFSIEKVSSDSLESMISREVLSFSDRMSPKWISDILSIYCLDSVSSRDMFKEISLYKASGNPLNIDIINSLMSIE